MIPWWVAVSLLVSFTIAAYRWGQYSERLALRRRGQAGVNDPVVGS
jgi:hypothetical protein